MTRRLLISYLTVTFIVLLLLEVPLGVFFADRERQRLSAAVERDAAVLASLYEDALQSGTAPDPRPARDYRRRLGARVVVVNVAGISVVDTDDFTDRDFSSRPEIATALAGRRSVGVRPSETLGTDLLFVAVPVASGGTVHGAVRITLTTSEVDARVRRFWWALGGIGAVVLAVMAGVGWILARSVTKPVRELEATAARLASGDLAARTVGGDGPAELELLGERFNEMAGHIEGLVAGQRAFVADASHQLRTPLTALRLRLENLDQAIEPAARPDLEGAMEETDRLARLVGQLLGLARTEQRQSARESVDLAEVAAERAATWEALADEHSVNLSVDAPASGVVVLAVPGAVEQVFDNLLDNALVHAPAGTTITLRVTPGADRHRLSVVDRGPGMSPEARERAFDRFWRGDTSPPGGTGLGLAIVRALVEASGGGVGLAEADGGGLEAVAWFPVATGA